MDNGITVARSSLDGIRTLRLTDVRTSLDGKILLIKLLKKNSPKGLEHKHRAKPYELKEI